MWIDRGEVEPTLIPTEGRARYRLRAFGPGRLEDLRERHRHDLRPQPSLWVGYTEPRKEEPEPEHPSPFDPGMIVLRQVDDNTIERVGKLKGQVVEKGTWKLSPDGSKLTITTEGEIEGQKYRNVQTFERTE